MTPLQQIWIASLAGAVLFFLAGAAAAALRARGKHVAPVAERPVFMREAIATPPALDTGELERAKHAEHAARQDLERSKQAELAARQDVERAKHAEQVARNDLERSRKAEHGARQALERTKQGELVARRELEDHEQRLREVEAQLADKTQTVRDLAADNDHLKGRVNEAEALRAEYVRLRTATTEVAYLKSEIARLESELQASKVRALGGRARIRPARGSVPAIGAGPRPIGESLAAAIERFSASGTRSVAIADRVGFPLAASGDDGHPLAAFAALLFEAAGRASQLLPVAAPATIELTDRSGARISVWTFDVGHDGLMLVELAVSPADSARVDAALADCASILAPSISVTGSIA